MAGYLKVTVNEGRGLQAKDPYCKFYLSKSGKDVKTTKQKTKTAKKTSRPTWQEKFKFPIPAGHLATLAPPPPLHSPRKLGPRAKRIG